MTKNNLDDGTLGTRDGQPPRLKSLIFRPRGFPGAGEMLQSAPLALARPMSTCSALRLVDIDQFKVDVDLSWKSTSTNPRSRLRLFHLKARGAIPDVDLYRPIIDQSRLIEH